MSSLSWVKKRAICCSRAPVGVPGSKRAAPSRARSAQSACARLQQMARFFTQLSDDMAGGISSAAAEDAATVLAALLHARRPLTAPELTDALGWSADRVAGALRDAETYAPFTDPLTIDRPTPTTYAVAAAPGRLTPAQRDALTVKAAGRPG
jgi:hypothetical protein